MSEYNCHNFTEPISPYINSSTPATQLLTKHGRQLINFTIKKFPQVVQQAHHSKYHTFNLAGDKFLRMIII